MAFHYLVDGYNLLYALPEIPSGTWQEKREKLLELLQRQHPQGNNPATVVFDNREGMGGRRQQGDLQIIFTSGETADEWIIERVREAKHPRQIIVVSNDRGIQALLRGTGAKFIPVADFLKVRSTRAGGSLRPKPSLPPEAEDITEELKKRWL